MKTLQERMALTFPLPHKWGLFAEIARLCGVSSPTVTAWFNKPEKVATLERANAEKLCQAYGLKYSPRWLAEGEGPMLVAAAAHEESNVSEGPTIRGLYPLISEVQAGMWTELCDNFAPGDAEDWLPSLVPCRRSHRHLHLSNRLHQPAPSGLFFACRFHVCSFARGARGGV